MGLTRIEFLKASLVFLNLHLLPDPMQVEVFRNAIDADVQSMPVAIGFSPEGQSPVQGLSIGRDRITLELSQQKSSATIEYPSGDAGLLRLAEVATQAIGITGRDNVLRGVGYNTEIAFEQDSESSASLYLAKRLFTKDLGLDGWDLAGGRCAVTFGEGDNTWNVILEPRYGDQSTARGFLSVNLHRLEQSIPDQSTLHHYLKESSDHANGFLVRLDQG